MTCADIFIYIIKVLFLMRRKGIIVFGQNLKVSAIVLLLLFEALNTPTNKLYDTSMRDATQWVNLQHFV